MLSQLHTADGNATGTSVTLPATIFDIAPDSHVIWLAIKQYLAHQRQGTHQTKERSQVAGSRKKLRKQKGAGRARVGDIKNPIFRGGGRIFGPKPHGYHLKLNKKTSKKARCMALSAKASQQQILLIDQLSIKQPKTKAYNAFLQQFDLCNLKTLLVLPQPDRNITMASRNLPLARTITAHHLNTYQILHADKIIITQAALPVLEKILTC